MTLEMTCSLTLLLVVPAALSTGCMRASNFEPRISEMTRSIDSAANASASFPPAPVVPLASQPPARLVVDAPLPEQLAKGYVVVRYRAENLRIMPVFGASALGVSPRLGHLHITIDDLPWHWLDASGEPLSINGLPPGPHSLLVELEDPTHKLIDAATIQFEIPQRSEARH